MENLRKQTLSGLGWSAASQMLGQSLQLVITAILSRLLSPREYGLLGMVVVFTGFAANFSDLSLGASIIQKRDVSERHLNSVFWLNVLVGGLLTLAFVLAAPVVARFYGEPSLKLLTAVVAINFILNSVNVVQSALLQKSLNFRAKFWANIAAIIVSGSIALTMVFTGAGIWSLVAQLLVATAVGTIVTWRLSSWRPTLSFDLSAIKELARFSNHLLGFNIINYWSRNIDKLVIGRVMGSAPLGIYSLASRLMQLPLTNVTDITQNVMFPALSAMQEDTELIRRVYLRGTRLIALFTFPMMIGLSALAEPTILTIYGDKWRAAIGIVQILCFAGLSQSVYNTASWIFLSSGQTKIYFRLGAYATLVRVVGIIIGIRWGIMGAAWAYFLGGFLIWYPTWAAAGRLIHISFIKLIRNLTGPFLCSAIMGAMLWFSDKWLLNDQHIWFRLVSLASAGVLVYLCLVRYLRLEAWRDFCGAVLEMGGGRSGFVRWLIGDAVRVSTE
jgi:O-antigen/teichoic acid export membrane protein